MKENLILLLQIITVNFFTAFGLYSLFFLITSIFTKKTFIFKVDEEAKKFISFVGIIYFIIWIVGTIVFYTESNLEEQNSLLNRMFGKYWVGFWVQPILWFSITQLLRIKKIWKNVLLRIIFSFLLIFSIEKFVIMIISFNRDYLPSSWTMYSDLGIYPSNFILALFVKIIMFLLFVWIFYLFNKKIENLKTKKLLK
jgi:hypothetical protein